MTRARPHPPRFSFGFLLAFATSCSAPDTGAAGPPAPAASSTPLVEPWNPDEDLWDHRPLVVLGPSIEDPRVATMRERVAAARTEFDARDMVWRFVDTTARDGALRARFEVPVEGFGVRLVGKDGGVKLESDQPLELEPLFELIDDMPMRQREMREAAQRVEP